MPPINNTPGYNPSTPISDEDFYSGRMHGLDAYRGVPMSLGMFLTHKPILHLK